MRPASIFLGIVLLVAAHPSQLPAQPVAEHGRLSVKGVQLTDQHGEAVVLRGVSYGWHNWWPRFYNAQTVKWFRDDWACTVVRAAMGIDPDRGYLKAPEWSLQRIEAVVEAAIANDVYVIIDWHSHRFHPEAAKSFFARMAKKYGHHPHVIYEIFNEPERVPWDEVKAYSLDMIAAIREIDPDNIILVGSPHWCQDLHLVADDPIVGHTNLMYTMHFYAGSHKQSLRDRCDYAIKKGIPVFVSESGGMQATGDGPLDLAEWKRWIDWMHDRQISWLAWSVADKNETCSMLLPRAASTGGWSEEDLKESGRLTRSYLKEFARKTQEQRSAR